MFLTLSANAGSQPTGALHIIGQPIPGIAYYTFQPSRISVLITLTFAIVEISGVGVSQIPSANTIHSQGFTDNRFNDLPATMLTGQSSHAQPVGKHNLKPFVCITFGKKIHALLHLLNYLTLGIHTGVNAAGSRSSPRHGDGHLHGDHVSPAATHASQVRKPAHYQRATTSNTQPTCTCYPLR